MPALKKKDGTMIIPVITNSFIHVHQSPSAIMAPSQPCKQPITYTTPTNLLLNEKGVLQAWSITMVGAAELFRVVQSSKQWQAGCVEISDLMALFFCPQQ